MKQRQDQSGPGFLPAQARAECPLLAQEMSGQPLVYLDNAATTQKPHAVLEAMRDYYHHTNANVHRSAHPLSAKATAAFEAARDQVATFINAPDRQSVIFTKGTTESINLVAASWGGQNLRPGDEILLTEMEHHANIVPWQLVAARTGALIKVVPITLAGTLDWAAFERLLGPKTRILALVHLSNVLGTLNPAADMIAKAKAVGAKVLLDGAQSAAHLAIDVAALDCDFFAFSAHKVYGPMGIGVLYGKPELLEAMPPYQGGGEMIEVVRFEGSTWNALPYKFEAGTPAVAEAIGLAAALRWLGGFDRQALMAHERHLMERAISHLKQMNGLRLVGDQDERLGALSFVPHAGHAHDIGTLLGEQGIAIRTGHHCAMPLMDALGVTGTARASFALYNTDEDVDRFAQALQQALELL